VTPDGKRVYVANSGSNNVSVISTASDTVTTTIAVGTAPRGVAVTPDGKTVYVTNSGSGTVSAISTATNTVIGTPIAVGSAPFGVAVIPDGHKVYVTNGAAGTVSVIATATNTVVGSPITVGTDPVGVAVAPDGTKVYVANFGSSNVSVIATASNTVAATIPVGTDPFGVAATWDGTKVYVANLGSNTVSVIETASNTVALSVPVGTAPAAFGAFIGAPTLTIAELGGGSGTVTSSPSGLNCGSTCSALFAGNSQVILSASAASGSTFSGWSGGGCVGVGTCSLKLSADTTVTANFVADTAGNLTLLAAVLPDSRSVEVGATPTAFATILNTGPDNGTTCTIEPATNIPASFVFQTTNPSTNVVTGTPNTPVNIPAGQGQTFVIGFTPSAAFAPTNVAFTFTCANALNPAVSTIGVDTLNLSASTTPVPDIVALAASGDPGRLDITGATGTGVFAVATVNLGVDATITAAANTGTATLPVTLTICQTNPSTGVCLAAAAASVTTDIPANATPTFGIFATGSGTIADDPAANRVFVTFTDSGNVLRGETSVAVRTH
jgi:YVTN family beta-propeller protein